MKRYHIRRENGKLSAPGVPAVETPTVTQYLLEGRLHRPDGPAVVTPRGTKQWYWKGVRVPQHVIEAPRATPVAEILQERNAEIRRVWLEAYGLEDALLDLGHLGQARVVDQQRDPARRLWEVTGCMEVSADGQQLDTHPHYVEVVCPSTDRRYFLRVPPNMRTAPEAVAWTFNVPSKEYEQMGFES